MWRRTGTPRRRDAPRWPAHERGSEGSVAPADHGSIVERGSQSSVEAAEIIWRVDVPCQRLVAQHPQGQADSADFVAMAGERSWSVGEAELAIGWHTDHVGAVAVAIGHEGDARETAHDGEA